MKITVERANAPKAQSPENPSPPPDLSEKPVFPPRRKTKAAGAGVRLKRERVLSNAKRSSYPVTHLLKGKFHECDDKNTSSVEDDRSSGEDGRGSQRGVTAAVSARKLAAGLWRLHSTESQSNVGEKLELQGHERKDLLHAPHSLSGAKYGVHLHKFEPSFQFPDSAMEGATKWDAKGWKPSDEPKQIFNQESPLHQQTVKISALEAELEQARTRISELETDRKSSKKKLEHFLRKLGEERSAWRIKEHEKIRAIIDDVKSELSKERKNRQRLEMMNSKLVNELTDAKLSAKRCLHEYEKQRKAREVLEEVCDELAKEIGQDRAEVEAIKSESMKIREEVEEERKMLQMAEVWREERVQMKLVDAKLMLEEKYSQMNRLVENIESFLKSTGATSLDSEEIKKVEFLQKVANAISMDDIRDLKYERGKEDDIFAVFEDVNFGECNEWESAGHPEDEGSSYSPDHDSESCDSGNHSTGCAMNGGREWPPIAEKNSLKARLVEARTESRKIQLRQVLMQKI